MLSELRIRNFVLIDELAIELGEGLNVLTGETGAGKSIVVDALSLALGERAKSGQVRLFADKALVEAVFETSESERLRNRLEEIGIPWNDGRLCIRRVVKADGRSSAYLNDSPVTLKALQEIVGSLVDLHGQHEHQSLLHRSVYRELVDTYGKHQKELQAVADLCARWRAAAARLAVLEGDNRQRARRIDQLTFEIEDIERTAPRLGEEEDLEKERKVLRNSARIEEGAAGVLDLLDGEEVSTLDRLNRAAHEMVRLATLDDSFGAWVGEIESVVRSAQALFEEIAAHLSDLEADPGRLDEVESRLYAFQELKRKYAADIAGVLEFLEKSREELRRLENWDAELEEAKNALLSSEAAYLEAAKKLSEKRRKVAKSLSQLIQKEMRNLGMQSARFEIAVDRRPEGPESYRPHGLDRVEFLVTANPGHPPQPLTAVASGGEISRMMLSIKTVLADVDRVPTLIFDEIDAGIGGRVAEIVGERLMDLGDRRQVLCITHLAQIAAKASTHFRVEKVVSGKKTSTRILGLDGSDREVELVRMLGAREDSEASRKVVRDLMAGR